MTTKEYCMMYVKHGKPRSCWNCQHFIPHYKLCTEPSRNCQIPDYASDIVFNDCEGYSELVNIPF